MLIASLLDTACSLDTITATFKFVIENLTQLVSDRHTRIEWVGLGLRVQTRHLATTSELMPTGYFGSVFLCTWLYQRTAERCHSRIEVSRESE